MKKNNQSFYSILGFLHIRPLTGYEIRKLVEESVQHFWHESEGHLYPSLKKMTELGLIAKLPQELSASKRKTIRYKITEDGRYYFNCWLHGSLQPRQLRDELLLKMFFCEFTDDSDALLLKHFQETQQKLKAKIEMLKEVHQIIKDDPDEKFPIMTVDFGLHMLQAKYDWLSKGIKTVGEEK